MSPLVNHVIVLNRATELTVVAWCNCGHSVTSHNEEACLRLLRRKHTKQEKGNTR